MMRPYPKILVATAIAVIMVGIWFGAIRKEIDMNEPFDSEASRIEYRKKILDLNPILYLHDPLFPADPLVMRNERYDEGGGHYSSWRAEWMSSFVRFLGGCLTGGFPISEAFVEAWDYGGPGWTMIFWIRGSCAGQGIFYAKNYGMDGTRLIVRINEEKRFEVIQLSKMHPPDWDLPQPPTGDWFCRYPPMPIDIGDGGWHHAIIGSRSDEMRLLVIDSVVLADYQTGNGIGGYNQFNTRSRIGYGTEEFGDVETFVNFNGDMAEFALIPMLLSPQEASNLWP